MFTKTSFLRTLDPSHSQLISSAGAGEAHLQISVIADYRTSAQILAADSHDYSALAMFLHPMRGWGGDIFGLFYHEQVSGELL